MLVFYKEKKKKKFLLTFLQRGAPGQRIPGAAPLVSTEEHSQRSETQQPFHQSHKSPIGFHNIQTSSLTSFEYRNPIKIKTVHQMESFTPVKLVLGHDKQSFQSAPWCVNFAVWSCFISVRMWPFFL